MRVLAISTDYPPHGCGGYEQQCRDSAEHLRREGHGVRVLSGTAPPAAGDREHDVYRDLPRFPVEPAPVAVRAAWRAERRAAILLGRELAAYRPDVVCFWRLGELSMSLPARVAAAGIPAVGMVCDPWMLDGPQRDPWTRTRTARFDGVARWLFVSPALRGQVSRAGVPVADAEIVPAGIDLPSFPLAAARPWRDRLLYVGRLSPLKGVDVVIRALSRLPHTTLDVVGGGARRHEEQLARLARSLRVDDRVRFRGILARPRVAAAYAAADAVVFPIRWREPFGLVPLEAMATGTPVIGVASGGGAETLLDGRTALVVPPDDPDAIAAAVGRLASDVALRQRLRAGGRRMAERYPAQRSHVAVRAALEAAATRRPGFRLQAGDFMLAT